MGSKYSIKENAPKKALRDAYGEALAELGEINEKVVVLDADLSGSTRTSMFAKKFPERFFNMGVAEADMISTSAGLAVAGKIPFASTFAIFASGRAWEQVRQSICLSSVNVKIVASHGGITVGEDGPSHQAMEDLALMRVLPNMTVVAPADANQTKAVLKFAVDHDGPMYIRLSREKFSAIYEDIEPFQLGKSDELRHGPDVAIIACGLMVSAALEAAQTLSDEGIEATVINMASIKPLDEEAVIRAASTCGAIVTAEEHSVIGGLGSAVMETVCENDPVPVIRVGMKSVFGKSGKPSELLDYFGLNSSSIIQSAKKAIALRESTRTR